MVKFALVSILSAVTTALAAAVDMTSVATSTLEERAALEICGPARSPAQVAAIVMVFDDGIFNKVLNNVITAPAGSCISPSTLGKWSSAPWTAPDAVVFAYKNADCTGDRLKLSQFGDDTTSYRSIKVFSP